MVTVALTSVPKQRVLLPDVKGHSSQAKSRAGAHQVSQVRLLSPLLAKGWNSKRNGSCYQKNKSYQSSIGTHPGSGALSPNSQENNQATTTRYSTHGSSKAGSGLGQPGKKKSGYYK